MCHNGSSGSSLSTFGFGHVLLYAPISLSLSSYHLSHSDNILPSGLVCMLTFWGSIKCGELGSGVVEVALDGALGGFLEFVGDELYVIHAFVGRHKAVELFGDFLHDLR